MCQSKPANYNRQREKYQEETLIHSFFLHGSGRFYFKKAKTVDYQSTDEAKKSLSTSEAQNEKTVFSFFKKNEKPRAFSPRRFIFPQEKGQCVAEGRCELSRLI